MRDAGWDEPCSQWVEEHDEGGGRAGGGWLGGGERIAGREGEQEREGGSVNVTLFLPVVFVFLFYFLLPRTARLAYGRGGKNHV